MAKLFTVIMDFEGTTSVAQFRADSPENAVRMWVDRLAEPGVYGLTPPQSRAIVRGARTILDDELVPITGTQGVWCADGLAGRRGLVLLNIVATCGAPISKPAAKRRATASRSISIS